MIKDIKDVSLVTRIGVMREDARHELLKSLGMKNLYTVTNHSQAINMLLAGRINLFATSDIEVNVLLQEMGENPNIIKSLWSLKKIQSYILVSKKTSDSLVLKWKDAFETIKKDGTFAKIGKKWAKHLGIPLTGENGVMEIRSK